MVRYSGSLLPLNLKSGSLVLMIGRVLRRKVEFGIVFILYLATLPFLINVAGGAWETMIDWLVKLATIISPLAIVVAISQYDERKKSEKRQVLQAIKSQLRSIAEWTKGKNGLGWSDEDCRLDSSVKAWSSPFHVVHTAEDRGLPLIWTNPGTASFPPNINDDIADFNQLMVTFNDRNKMIREYKSSLGAKALINISKKQTQEIPLSKEEEDQVHVYLTLYKDLHRGIIGTQQNKYGLFTLRKRIAEYVDAELQKLE